MSVTIHDAVLSRGPRSGRRKGTDHLSKLREALARRKLEEMREQRLLEENIYDVFADDKAAD